MAKIEDVATSVLTEIFGHSQAGPVAGETRSDTVDRLRAEDTQARVAEKPVAAALDTETRQKNPKPTQPDPQEVQYPGYFKDGGSL